jgi:hypothetical protein
MPETGEPRHPSFFKPRKIQLAIPHSSLPTLPRVYAFSIESNARSSPPQSRVHGKAAWVRFRECWKTGRWGSAARSCLTWNIPASQLGRSMIRFREKDGKETEIPVHHKLEELLDQYLETSGRRSRPTAPLFPIAVGRTRKLGSRQTTRIDAARMLKRRLKDAGLSDAFSPHSFRTTGITNFWKMTGLLKPPNESPATPTAGPRKSMTAAVRRYCSRIWKEFGIKCSGQIVRILPASTCPVVGARCFTPIPSTTAAALPRAGFWRLQMAPLPTSHSNAGGRPRPSSAAWKKLSRKRDPLHTRSGLVQFPKCRVEQNAE